MSTKVKEKNISVDSLKLRIPIHSIKIIDETFIDRKTKLIVSDSTGVVLEETKLKSLSKSIPFDAYEIKVAIVSRFDFQRRTNIDYLEIYLHSKILEDEYFEGINAITIDKAYHKLMSANIFSCSYEDFMSAKVNDIDIKHDVYEDTKTFKEFTKYLQSNAKSNNNIGKGCLRYSKTGNIQFNRRESGTKANPFLKVYDKYIEATERKDKFFNKYIDKDVIQDLKRIETTIKSGSDVKKQLGIKDNTLQSVLSVSLNSLKDVIKESVNKNLVKRDRIVIKRKQSKRNMNDKLIYTLLYLNLNSLKVGYNEAQRIILSQFDECRQQKSTVKKRIEQIYMEDFKTDENVQKNERILKLMDTIGWGM